MAYSAREMLRDFPTMLPITAADNQELPNDMYSEVVSTWQGNVKVQDKLFQLTLQVRRTLPPPPLQPAPESKSMLATQMARSAAPFVSSLRLYLAGEKDMHELLRGQEKRVQQCWDQNQKVHLFLRELRDMLNDAMRREAALRATTTTAAAKEIPPPVLDQIAAEVALLPRGWADVKSCREGKDGLQLDFVVKDAAKREHVLTLRLTENYPRIPPAVAMADLPLLFDASLPASFAAAAASPGAAVTAASSPLCTIFSRFQAVVGQYQTLWSLLDYLDARAWVLEPLQPIRRKELKRKIALAPSCWLDLELNPRDPLAVPSIRISGPESVTDPLREKLQRHLAAGDWERSAVHSEASASTLHSNILRVLDLPSLPLPTETPEDEEYNLNCMICYCHLLGEEAPDFVCPNCSRVFHTSCLADWFRDSGGEIVFQSIQGECTHCKTKLTVPLPSA